VEEAVTMATTILQPDGTTGKDTMVTDSGGTYDPTATFMYVGSHEETEEPRYAYRGLIEFSGLPTVEATEYVRTATLSLYCSGESDTVDRVVSAYANTAAWSESGASWANKPATAASAAATATITGTSAWFDWAITDLVEAWIAGTTTNNGLTLIGVESSDTARKTFLTSDHATAETRPKLTIVTNLRPTITITNLNGSQVSPTALNNDTTPTFTGVYTSADSVAMTHRQHIVYDELGGTVWDSGVVAEAADSGDTISVTIPAGYLRYGRKYKWKWQATDANGGTSLWTDYGWFRPTLTTTAAATDLAAGDHLYAQTTTGRIVALEEGTTNLGTAIAWRETFVVPLVNEDDWFKTLFLSRVWGRIYLPVGSTGSVYYSTRMEDLSDGADWETAQALTAQAGIQVFDFAVPFTSGDDFMGNAFRVKVTGTGPHKLHGLKFYYEERDE
jgi:hypothetical protein